MKEFQEKVKKFLDNYNIVGSNIIVANKNDIIASLTYGYESIEKIKKQV